MMATMAKHLQKMCSMQVVSKREATTTIRRASSQFPPTNRRMIMTILTRDKSAAMRRPLSKCTTRPEARAVSVSASRRPPHTRNLPWNSMIWIRAAISTLRNRLSSRVNRRRTNTKIMSRIYHLSPHMGRQAEEHRLQSKPISSSKRQAYSAVPTTEVSQKSKSRCSEGDTSSSSRINTTSILPRDRATNNSSSSRASPLTNRWRKCLFSGRGSRLEIIVDLLLINPQWSSMLLQEAKAVLPSSERDDEWKVEWVLILLLVCLLLICNNSFNWR